MVWEPEFDETDLCPVCGEPIARCTHDGPDVDPEMGELICADCWEERNAETQRSKYSTEIEKNKG